jgi:hypothetical protein
MTGIQLRLFISGLLLGWLLVEAPAIVFGGSQSAQKTPAQSTRSAPPQGIPKPSLDALRSRAIAYWNLLARGQKSQALQYVEPSRRENFKARQTPPFSEPRITAFGLSAKPDEVSVTAEVKRIVLPIPNPMYWPVTEKWVFRNGNWFVMVENPAELLLFPTSPGHAAPVLSPEETEKRRKAILEALQFETQDLEFGTVRQGDNVFLSLGYQLAGDEAFGIVLRDSLEDFYVRNLRDRKLPPGKEQKIQMELLTRTYAGEVNERFTAVISHQDVEVPFEFKVHGFVYVPVSATPRALKFLKGEREKEIVLKNNSKSEVTVNAVSNAGFSVTSLPQKLSPGADCRLKIAVLSDKQDKNLQSVLSFSFAESVEGTDGLDVPVILNYEEVKPKTAQEQAIEDLLRKANLPIKK